jgi:putative membrane protein
MSDAAPPARHVETANELAERRTNLAVARTALADDRTLMAWIRTSLSMIGFGFTIYKFLKELAQLENSKLPDNGPRNLGLTLVGLGTASLIVASFQHWSNMRELERHASLRARFSLVLVVAITITALGALVFFSMVLHMGPF